MFIFKCQRQRLIIPGAHGGRGALNFSGRRGGKLYVQQEQAMLTQVNTMNLEGLFYFFGKIWYTKWFNFQVSAACPYVYPNHTWRSRGEGGTQLFCQVGGGANYTFISRISATGTGNADILSTQ